MDAFLSQINFKNSCCTVCSTQVENPSSAGTAGNLSLLFPAHSKLLGRAEAVVFHGIESTARVPHVLPSSQAHQPSAGGTSSDRF